jgi:ABC-type sugar transport system ATPase subunit
MVLNNGITEQYGKAETIYNRPANTLVARLIGDPPMNLIEGEVDLQGPSRIFKFDGTKIDLSDQDLKSVKDNKIILGIRPNNISISTDNGTGKIQGTVYSIEKYGVSTVVAMKVSEKIIKAIFRGRTQYKIGEKVYIYFDLNGACLFNIDKKLIQVLGRDIG